MRKSLFLVLVLVFLSACATPYLDRLMYEDQVNADKRNYLIYREEKEVSNRDKIKAGLEPECVLSREEWSKTQAPSKFVINYERNHPKSP